MALQLGALRDALIDGGAKPELANKAAEEVASFEQRIASIDTRLAVLQWMTAFVLAGVVAILWKVFGT